MTPTPANLSSVSTQFTGSARAMMRKHVVARLCGRTLAGNRVFDNRVTRPDTEEQPCIYVLVKDEPAERFEDTPVSYDRNLTLYLEVYAHGGVGDPNPADLIDAICNQVEHQMQAVQRDLVLEQIRAGQEGEDLGWCFNPDKSGLQGTSMDADAEGIQLEAGARVTWSLSYVTRFDESELDGEEVLPLEGINAHWDLNSDGEINATDDIELLQE